MRRKGQRRTTGKNFLLDQQEERVGGEKNFGDTNQWEEENVLGIER